MTNRRSNRETDTILRGYVLGIEILHYSYKEQHCMHVTTYGALSGSKFNVQTFSSLNFETSLFAYNYFLIAAQFPV